MGQSHLQENKITSHGKGQGKTGDLESADTTSREGQRIVH